MTANIETLASIAAGVMVLAAAVWKVYLRLKSDRRVDGAAEDSYDGYGRILSQMRQEIDRLSRAVNDMGLELERERKARHEAQAENGRLTWRVSVLEAEVRRLGGVVPD